MTRAPATNQSPNNVRTESVNHLTGLYTITLSEQTGSGSDAVCMKGSWVNTGPALDAAWSLLLLLIDRSVWNPDNVLAEVYEGDGVSTAFCKVGEFALWGSDRNAQARRLGLLSFQRNERHD